MQMSGPAVAKLPGKFSLQRVHSPGLQRTLFAGAQVCDGAAVHSCVPRSMRKLGFLFGRVHVCLCEGLLRDVRCGQLGEAGARWKLHRLQGCESRDAVDDGHTLRLRRCETLSSQAHYETLCLLVMMMMR